MTQHAIGSLDNIRGAGVDVTVLLFDDKVDINVLQNWT